ncbi:hypothetical protein MTR_5g091830 [Medicago truncatula]|uniref:Uncharacterized protein n=1 Tax=Medicago truncatula TaxID=3880 RepID=G7K3E2_MEDTR|nr:hypothetical protein MTR_5g091830 [Medicago truncatula]
MVVMRKEGSGLVVHEEARKTLARREESVLSNGDVSSRTNRALMSHRSSFHGL